MGEFVQDRINAAGVAAPCLENFVPGKGDWAAVLGLAEQVVFAFDDCAAVQVFPKRRSEAARINQHRLDAAEVVQIQTQYEKASLGGDRDFDLVGHGEVAARLPVALRDKEAEALAELGLQV